ncbi:MAG: hypothetical protein C6Y22_28575 [Hapalosiphonaceae cyanobacterium JJU2]|nr:MAG: hypothetical protein C6Y22_28575 [Hapalosiphonaceae cyanobacterium JJU2]
MFEQQLRQISKLMGINITELRKVNMSKTLTNDKGPLRVLYEKPMSASTPVAHGGDPQDLAGSQMTTPTS